MSNKVVVFEQLKDNIRKRREELGLTVEEAAGKVGVSAEDWARWEEEGAVRMERIEALTNLLGEEVLKYYQPEFCIFDLDEFRSRPYWSSYLEKEHGIAVAVAFVYGYEMLHDHILDDIDSLRSLPEGSLLRDHEWSQLIDMLPDAFEDRYDMAFLLRLQSANDAFAKAAGEGKRIIAHTVLEELTLLLNNLLSQVMMEIEGTAALKELFTDQMNAEEAEEKDDDYFDNWPPENYLNVSAWQDWVYNVLGDDDIGLFLYTDCMPVIPEYHYDNWLLPQFYMHEEYLD